MELRKKLTYNAMNREELEIKLRTLRVLLEKSFSPHTAKPGFDSEIKSAGQCAAVASVTHDVLGGVFVSAIVENQSHWFNRIYIDDGSFDVDLTGDQFGRPKVQIAEANTLYPNTKLRKANQLQKETLDRASLLESKIRKDSLIPA